MVSQQLNNFQLFRLGDIYKLFHVYNVILLNNEIQLIAALKRRYIL